MGQVEQPAGQQRGRAVREHVAQLGRQGRHRLAGPEPDPQPRVPEQRHLLGRPLPGQRRRVVVALVGRLAPRQRPGAAVPGRRADVGQHVVASASPSPSPRTSSRCAGQRPGRRRPPLAVDQHAVGARPGRPLGEPGRAPAARRTPRRSRAASGPTTGPSPAPGRGAGRAARSAVDMWLHGPSSSRCGVPCAASAVDRAERVVAVAVGPAADQDHRAPDPVVRRSHRPWRQYAESCCSSIQRTSHGSSSSTRVRHASRHPSPTSAGTGGSAFIATMYAG